MNHMNISKKYYRTKVKIKKVDVDNFLNVISGTHEIKKRTPKSLECANVFIPWLSQDSQYGTDCNQVA